MNWNSTKDRLRIDVTEHDGRWAGHACGGGRRQQRAARPVPGVPVIVRYAWCACDASVIHTQHRIAGSQDRSVSVWCLAILGPSSPKVVRCGVSAHACLTLPQPLCLACPAMPCLSALLPPFFISFDIIISPLSIDTYLSKLGPPPKSPPSPTSRDR